MSDSNILEVTVSGEPYERLDKWLSTLDFIPSRARASELIAQGLVTIKGKPLKASYIVRSGLCVRIELPAAVPTALQPLVGPLEILFQDEDLLVVNKPAGLVVHPAAGHAQDTLVNLLLHHVHNLAMGFAENRPGIVHRLDRDTSGILVVAKNDFSHQALALQFRKKTAHRIYWAIVHGFAPTRETTIRSYLARHPKDRKRFASHKNQQGKLAITHFRALQVLPAKISWIQCRLETGRTHQIRVHLSEAGLPIMGDPLYGKNSKSVPRMALHACELGFTHPRTLQEMRFHLDWPPELQKWVIELGFKHV